MNQINDIDMWIKDNDFVDIEDNLDNCFSAMETFDPDDPYMDMEPLDDEPAASSSINNSLDLYDENRDPMFLEDVDSSPGTLNGEESNEYQECFEQFHSNYSPVSCPVPSRSFEERQKSTRSNEETFPLGGHEFDRDFRRLLSNLEQSMRRSEQSRKLLGEHRSAISVLYNNVCASTNGTNQITKGRAQLLSYMTMLGNNTL